MSRLDWVIPLSAGLAAGLALGLAYYGGLWWTSRRIVSASGSPILPMLSFVGRLALLAVGLGLIARLQPLMLLGSLPGLMAARALCIRAITGAGSSASPPVSTVGPEPGEA
ncbi:MAG: ATP synthase subunit I [Acidimicrobiia bacterium]|nr:ATP synthase subunit I [Acidimicrobiia bacterium]